MGKAVKYNRKAKRWVDKDGLFAETPAGKRCPKGSKKVKRGRRKVCTPCVAKKTIAGRKRCIREGPTGAKYYMRKGRRVYL